MDFKEFAKVLAGIAGNFGASIEPAVADLWFEAFKADGVSIKDIRAAALNIIRNKANGYGRMPTYAEILQEIRGNPEDVANGQIAFIRGALRTNGAGNPPEFTDTITSRLMRTRWSWSELVMFQTDKLPFWEKDFKAAYLSAFNNDQRPEPQIEGPPELLRIVQEVANANTA